VRTEVFDQRLSALAGRDATFSDRFLEWLRSLVAVVDKTAPQPGDFRVSTIAAPRPGELLADGSVVSRTTYAQLFAIVGTTFGAGDGVTTFALPNMATVMAGVYFFVRVS